ncbi:hypothetical protein PUNSTDRAFT_131157 [Punctularia strigosozonata HHB-11173 SS5]|uniref:uncharacterized protein n=1 Tax=Punctularia strigosozonata (strain HHB-11173) TaxID=741275 RepID=UPI0004418093|nr:uncharacterized protein PUNSTDRAFT_131157 [Punctularia strigosozonata HHB-11173 SS5]EIN12925.1 hypothetical protein PUNSTDRAFT_131157 [Punctularia strigosozonata HHB-11173 SS5]
MTYQYLTPEDIDHFLEYGYIRIDGAFTREASAQWTSELWPRLGMDPKDKSTWPTDRDRIHMPDTKRIKVADFAPKAWAAICDLLGGEDRIDEKSATWSNGFIVNLGLHELVGREPLLPKELDNWHVDGDFFIHFLDSPEQALLVIPVFSDIEPRGGGTYICPDGIDIIAKYLHSHPEGVMPVDRQFVPSTGTNSPMDPVDTSVPGYWSHLREVQRCSHFVEMTGKIGDVVLMHPLMMHSASKNHLRTPRVITNPPVSLKEPFRFDGSGHNLSLVEKKTLRALGVNALEGWSISGERRMIVPKRVLIQQKMRQEEEKRLAALREEAAKAH